MVSRSSTARLRALSSVSALALCATPALAQDPAAGIEEIVIRGVNLSRQIAVENKRNSDAIIDSISADDLGRLPDKNTAEALSRVPGVNITIDQGEGRYVSIRGASPALNSVTINGLAVGSVEENSRRVPLDILGGELLGGIDVVKAVTPDLEANAIGGYINVKTQSPHDNDQTFFGRASARIGDDEYGGHHPYAADATVGGKLGSDEAFGVLLGVSFTDRHYWTKGLYADDWRDIPGVSRGIPESHKFNDYNLDRERFTITGVAEYKPGDDALYYARVVWTDAQESEYRYRNRNYFSRIITPQPGRFAITGTDSGTYTNQRLRVELRAEDKLRRIGNFAVGGENTFDAVKVEYAASLIDNRMTEPNQNWVFQAPDTFSSGTWDMKPEYFEIRPNTPVILANVANIGINTYTTQELIDDDEGWQSKLDVTYDLDGSSFAGHLKAGALYRSMKKTQDINSENYTPGTGGTAAFNVGSPGVWTGDVIEGGAGGAFYETGPRLNFEGIDAFTRANIANAAVLRRDATASLTASTTSDFVTEENILSGYAMANLEFGAFTVIGGLRIEHTDVASEGFSLTGTTRTPLARDGSYTHYLPGLHLQYREEDSPFIARFAWTNTIGRPEYPDIAAIRTVTRAESTPGVFDGAVREGNPDLEAYESMNFDISLEYYLANSGIISLAGFYKEVDGFIFEERITQTNVTLDGLFYDRLTTDIKRNANNGKIKGLELGYQQQWTFLPAPFNGLGAGASATLVDSAITLPGRTDETSFIGQADTIYSLSAFYQYGPFETVLSYDWADVILVAPGAAPAGDFYDKSYGRLDLKANYRLTENISVFAELLNLNDAPLGEFQGKKEWVTRREFYGRQGFVGMTVKW